MYRKATGMSYAEYQQKQASQGGTNVGTMLSRVEATAPGSQLAEGNYIQTVRWKITLNRGADYGNYIQKMVLPLDAQAVKEGRILGWGASRNVYPALPAAGGATFDAVTSVTYKDLANGPAYDAGQCGSGAHELRQGVSRDELRGLCR